MEKTHLLFPLSLSFRSQLVLTVGLLAVVVYLYTVVAFNFFRKFYNKSEDDDEPDMKCDDMMTVRIPCRATWSPGLAGTEGLWVEWRQSRTEMRVEHRCLIRKGGGSWKDRSDGIDHLSGPRWKEKHTAKRITIHPHMCVVKT